MMAHARLGWMVIAVSAFLADGALVMLQRYVHSQLVISESNSSYKNMTLLKDFAQPAEQCHKVSLHTILIGVMGTIYKFHTELPLSKLGLDRCRVRKLNLDLNTHSIQYATKIINTTWRLKNTKERTYGSLQNPPDPH